MNLLFGAYTIILATEAKFFHRIVRICGKAGVEGQGPCNTPWQNSVCNSPIVYAIEVTGFRIDTC